jgi:hypothetical protein
MNDDVIIECMKYTEIRDLIKYRILSTKWKTIIDTFQWNFEKQDTMYLYKVMYMKKQNIFEWLMKNTIDPHFKRTKNLVAFSILYSNESITLWLLNNKYPIDVYDSLEVRAIGKKQNIKYYRIFKNYLQILIKNGCEHYTQTLRDLNNVMYGQNDKNHYEKKYKSWNYS